MQRHLALRHLALRPAALPRAARCRVALLAVAAVLVAWPAAAAVPGAVSVDGALLTNTGGAAPDGIYKLTFKLYKDSFGGAALWSEGPVSLPVGQGGFHHALGSVAPIDAKVLAGLPTAWLGVTVESEPELPRKPVLSAPFALRAGVADALECSGCVTDKHLDPALLQGLVKAGELSKVAQSGQYADLGGKPDLSGYVKASTLKDVALTGQYGDLQGLPVLAKVGASCGTGLVMKGLKADGSLDCAQGGFDAQSLPKDGLDDISNGLLTNQFTETFASAKTPIAIADGSGAGVSDTLTVPDVGIAQGLSVALELSNSDISKVRVTLFAPGGATYVLYDQGKQGTALKGTWPSPDATVTGDLSTWVGKNPAGLWSINVADLQGNSGGADGKISAWSIAVKTVSNKKVALTGGLQFHAAATHPVTCTPAQLGFTYLNTADSALYICNGTGFFPIALVVAPGSSKEAALPSCKDVLAKAPLAKDGVYWINPGGGQAFQAFCDMTTAGGGWTRCLAHRYMPKLPGSYQKTWISTQWNTNNTTVFDDGPSGSSYGNFCPAVAGAATQIYGRARYPAGFGGDFETNPLALPKNFFDATSQVVATGAGNHGIGKDNGTNGQGHYGLGCGTSYAGNKNQGIHALCLSNGAKYQAQHTGWTSGQYPGSCPDSSSQPCTCTQGDYCGGSNPKEMDIVMALYVR
ncbi:MAG: proprotein convertase P-domain-containing protein [Deltaproteobacteria bacterium]|nr:proprotein convertase P-domain-containing protein [Deltaproteobacteria bacterium]